MATYSKRVLSGSTNGKQIKVTGTTSGGSVTVHTAVSGTSDLDEMWIYADNDSTSPVLLTLEFGGTTDVDNTIKVTIPPRGEQGNDGLFPVVPGLVLQNSLVLKAFAATGNVIKLSGYVNRIDV